MISVDTKTKILRLYIDGSKATDIAIELNCSKHDVYNLVNNCGEYSNKIKEMHKINKNKNKDNEALASMILNEEV